MDLFAHFFENLDQVLETPQVDAGLGLIKNGKPGAAGEDSGDFDTLELTARKRGIDFAVDIIFGAQADLC